MKYVREKNILGLEELARNGTANPDTLINVERYVIIIITIDHRKDMPLATPPLIETLQA